MTSPMRRCWSIFAHTVQIIIGTILGLLMVPITVPVLFILWIWRTLVLVVLWTIKGGEVTLASGMEAMWGLDYPEARAVITAVLVLKGQVNISQVRNLLENNILNVIDSHGRIKYPRFRQYLRQVVGVSVWLPDRQFCVRRHVRCLPEVPDENGLINGAAELANTPLPSENPQWEVLVVPITKYLGTPHTSMLLSYPNAMSTPLSHHRHSDQQPSHTALLLRLHHALGDGRSLVQLMLSALVDHKSPETPHMDPVLESSGSRCLHFVKMLWALTQLPWVAWRLLVRHDRSQLHGAKLSGTKHLSWAPPINLVHFKTIKEYTNASVNDTLLTCVAEAIRRYLVKVDDRSPSTTTVVVPVDVWGTVNPEVPANKNSLCTLRLPTGEMPLMMRLCESRKRLCKLKKSPDVVIIHTMMDKLLNFVPAPLARWGLSTKGVSLVTSNMKGPSDNLYILGLTVDDLMFWVPNKSWTGVGISILSYRGWVRVGIAVDTALIQSQATVQALVDDIAYQFHQLLTQVQDLAMAQEVSQENLKNSRKLNKRCVCSKCLYESLKDHIDINNMEKGNSERTSLIDLFGQKDQLDLPSTLYQNNRYQMCRYHHKLMHQNSFNIMDENPDGFLFIDEE